MASKFSTTKARSSIKTIRDGMQPLKQLLPQDSPQIASLVKALVEAAAKMQASAREVWTTRFDLIYGDLSGQRGVPLEKITGDLRLDVRGASLHDVLIGLQSYFVLVSDFIAASSLADSPHNYLEELQRLTDAEFKNHLKTLSDGSQLRDAGVSAPLAFDFAWYIDLLDEGDWPHFKFLAAAISALWTGDKLAIKSKDPLQAIYAALMPKNLLHVMGEFYTPFWLAELLLQDAGWAPEEKPRQTLTDPFAGSGVFLLAAIDIARSKGLSGLSILPYLRAIDLNPIACVAVRTNLIVALSDEIKLAKEIVHLPVLCADAITAAFHDDDDDDDDGQINPADIVATNPPWVGWEYISRSYRTQLEPLWLKYGLFTSTGRNAAFLKEDLSTLAMMIAWDKYLKAGGKSAVVLRPATMKSDLASVGMRRLSIFPEEQPLSLQHIQLFQGIKVFDSANTETATWTLEKGRATTFPVRVSEWCRQEHQLQPTSADTMTEIVSQWCQKSLQAIPLAPDDLTSRWLIGADGCISAAVSLAGSNAYVGRTGVFTGGANAVYYLKQLSADNTDPVALYKNIVERSKRQAPIVEVELEKELVYNVVRGRDLFRWMVAPELKLLCPHTSETKIRAIAPGKMAASYPLTLEYVTAMRPVLDERKGFSGWEQDFRDESFYAIQRVGAYTFSQYKVGWRYIASDFIVAVIGPDAGGRPMLPNDKVMFVSVSSAAEAYYLCGILSSDPMRWKVVSSMTNTQISTNAIKHLKITPFDDDDPLHVKISACCREGHRAIEKGDSSQATKKLAEINICLASVYGLSPTDMQAFRDDLQQTHPDKWFSVTSKKQQLAPLH
ncbi:MAG: N-6 DNA methylase [Cyanobacteria bacterium REEB67]|nr:N-6 DNA methylase [Cyanobacteria bacterium REEB67]